MASNTLAPGLLLASARLGDPNFERTVVLLARHDAEGALGWVINGRNLGPVRELLSAAGLVPEGVTLPDTSAFALPARVGGPVAPASGWIVFRHQANLALPGEIDAGPDIRVTGHVDALATLLRGHGPEDFRLVLGYAGWGPGQLEGEIAEGAWLPADVSVDLLFDTATEKLWDAAYYRTIGSSPGAFSGARRGSA